MILNLSTLTLQPHVIQSCCNLSIMLNVCLRLKNVYIHTYNIMWKILIKLATPKFNRHWKQMHNVTYISYNHDVLCKIIRKLFKKHFIPYKRFGGGGGHYQDGNTNGCDHNGLRNFWLRNSSRNWDMIEIFWVAWLLNPLRIAISTINKVDHSKYPNLLKCLEEDYITLCNP